MNITFKANCPNILNTKNLAQALRAMHNIRKSLRELTLLNIGATIATHDAFNRECSKYALAETELALKLHILHSELSVNDLLNWDIDPVALIAEAQNG